MLVTNVSGKPVDLVVCVKVGGVYVFCTCLLPYSRSRICEMTPALSNLSGAAAAGWGVGTLGRGPCFGWSDGPVAEVFLCCDRNLEVLRVVVVVVFDVVVVAPGSWWSNEMTSRSAVGGGVDVMVGAVRRTRVAAGVSLLDAMKSFCCSRRDCSSLFLLILGWVLIVGGLWWVVLVGRCLVTWF